MASRPPQLFPVFLLVVVELFFLLVIVAGPNLFAPRLSEFLAARRGLLLVGHVSAVVTGVIWITIGDILFTRFLLYTGIPQNDVMIRKLHLVSRWVWGALAIIVISGFGLYIPEAARLNHAPKFILKMIVVAVLVVNGTFLNIVVAPRFVRFQSFVRTGLRTDGQERMLFYMACASGAVSFVSWWSALILGFLSALPLSFMTGLAVYIGLVAVMIGISQIVAWYIGARAKLDFPR
ncbi:MAG: Uncharacterized protein G01um101466_396 [Parcubacteria group bacterium Gr01-1014_66]|nr:MAG: Uncharacterized protein G01um101466_396 [Parcubacteria group bacterium Gr01-1014_66]